MKKHNFLAIALGCVICGSMVSCGQVEGSIDTSKTQLYVTVGMGGLGSDWLYKTAEAFNAQSSEYQAIVVDSVKDTYDTTSATIEAGTAEADLYFNIFSDYIELAEKGYLEDISGVLDKKPDGPNGKTVREKMNNSQQFIDMYTYNDKLYAIPGTELIFGMNIDYTMFKENGWLLTDADGTYTAGSDKVKGTADDGWPVTVAQFQEMINIISSDAYIFNFSGKYADYLTHCLEEIWAMHEGKANWEISYTYNGTYKKGDVEKVITMENGYETFKMEGKLKALEFMETFWENPEYTTTYSRNQLTTHTQSQEYYLQQVIESKGYQKSAIQLDGEWWEKEAQRVFNMLEKAGYEDYKYKTRDYRFMPIPAFEGAYGVDGKGNGAVLSAAEDGNIFLLKQDEDEKGRKVVAAAEEFLSFCMSNKMLELFTIETGSRRPYEVTYSDEAWAQISPYAKNVIWWKDRADVQIVHQHVIKFSTKANYRSSYPIKRWTATVNNIEYYIPYYALSPLQGKATAQGYYDSLASGAESNWSKVLAALETFD